MFLQRAVPILTAALLCAAAANAQSTNASIYGSVTDSSGAAAPKATVTATNIKTGVSQGTVTNADGVYLFPSLQPGEYKVAGELTGFRKSVSSGIQLAVGARISVDLKLEIGVSTETVTVEASGGVEAITSSVSNVVSQQRVQDLPRCRDAGALIALQAAGRHNFNGARSQSQNVTLDGVDIQEPRYTAALQRQPHHDQQRGSHRRIPRQHRAGRRRVRRASRRFQMVGRSGTNEYHGSVFEFNRVTALSANDWFNNQLAVTRRQPGGAAKFPDPQSVRRAHGRPHQEEQDVRVLPI